MCDLAIIWQARKRDEEALALMSKVVDFSERVLGLGHPATIIRRQNLDKWGSQPYQYSLAGDDQGTGTYPSSQGPGTLVHEGLTQAPQATTKAPRTVEPALNHKTYSGIRKPDLRRREMLKPVERLFTSSVVSQGFKQKLQQRRDLLIEYEIDDRLLPIFGGRKHQQRLWHSSLYESLDFHFETVPDVG